MICRAIEILGERINNRTFKEIYSNFWAKWRYLISDHQFRWLGTERALVHMALGALVNALFEIWARYERKPVWKLITDFTPEEIVRSIDFRYINDALTPEETLQILRNAENERQKIEPCVKE